MNPCPPCGVCAIARTGSNNPAATSRNARAGLRPRTAFMIKPPKTNQAGTSQANHKDTSSPVNREERPASRLPFILNTSHGDAVSKFPSDQKHFRQRVPEVPSVSPLFLEMELDRTGEK